MKKTFFLFAFVLLLMSSCVTTRYVDAYGREHTKTTVHPIVGALAVGVTEALVYHYDTGYYYDSYGYPDYNYATGVLDQYMINNHLYCRKSCTYRGRGHRHVYYTPPPPPRRQYYYDGGSHVRRVTNQYYYGTGQCPPW